LKQKDLLKELIDISNDLGIKIIHSKGNFKGGYCILKKEKIIAINKNLPVEQRLTALINILSTWDTSNIYIKPAIRELIKSETLK